MTHRTSRPIRYIPPRKYYKKSPCFLTPEGEAVEKY